MTDLVERLHYCRVVFDDVLVLVDAIAEIKRLTVNLDGSVAALKIANDEIDRMQAEIHQFEEQFAEATAEIEKLRELWENSPSTAR